MLVRRHDDERSTETGRSHPDGSATPVMALRYSRRLCRKVIAPRPSWVIIQVKYLNDRVEQDRRAVKRVTRPMLEFPSFASAKAALG